MDKFKQILMTKKLRLSPDDVEVTELLEYLHFQKYATEAIEEVHRIINNPMLDILGSTKANLNAAIVKAMKAKK